MSPPDTRATKNTTGTHGRDDPRHNHHRVHRAQPASPRHLTHAKLAPVLVELPHLGDVDAHARTEACPLDFDAQQVEIDIGKAERGEVSLGPAGEEGVHGGAAVWVEEDEAEDAGYSERTSREEKRRTSDTERKQKPRLEEHPLGSLRRGHPHTDRMRLSLNALYSQRRCCINVLPCRLIAIEAVCDDSGGSVKMKDFI